MSLRESGIRRFDCPRSYGVSIMRQPGDMTQLGTSPPGLGSLTDIVSVSWTRVRSSQGVATVFATGCGANNELLVKNQNLIDPWAFELVIHRDSRIALMGPILDIVWHAESQLWEITAGDIMTWTKVRVIEPAFSNPSPQDAATILRDLLNLYFNNNDDDPDLYRNVMFLGTSASQVQVEYKTRSFTVDDKVRELINMGANYAVVGRAILIFGEDPPNLDKSMVISGDDVTGDVGLFKSGRSPFATGVVGRGRGITSRLFAGSINEGYFGEVTRITQFDGITDVSELSDLTTAWRNTVNVMRHDLDISAGATLSQSAVFSGETVLMDGTYALDFLIPGYRYDIAISPPTYPIKGIFPMRLDKLSVSWTPTEGEKVGVSFVTLGGLQP